MTRPDQLTLLNALIVAAFDARDAARNGNLFASAKGRKLVMAAYDLFEVDGLYGLANDIAHELRAPSFNVDQICDERREGL